MKTKFHLVQTRGQLIPFLERWYLSWRCLTWLETLMSLFLHAQSVLGFVDAVIISTVCTSIKLPRKMKPTVPCPGRLHW